jgi:hypothetical protein
MRVNLIITLNVIALVQFGSAGNCDHAPSYDKACGQCSPAITCGDCNPGPFTGNVWCSDSASSKDGGCCDFGFCSWYLSYRYEFSCDSFTYYFDDKLLAILCVSVGIWLGNMLRVFLHCRANNLNPLRYLAIALFFGPFVWCCLNRASRRQQIVIVRTANDAVPYQAQPT